MPRIPFRTALLAASLALIAGTGHAETSFISGMGYSAPEGRSQAETRDYRRKAVAALRGHANPVRQARAALPRTGSGSTATVIQTGQRNSAQVTQRGNNKSAFVIQTGNDTDVQVTQNGRRPGGVIVYSW